MARWGDEKTLLFVMQYREYECLWNTSSPLYKNKIARDNAYKKLCSNMNDENLTIKFIKNKIKNLRTTYHQELKKIKDSMRSGAGSSDVYKPTIPWFKEMHSFLEDSTENRETMSTPMTSQTSRESDRELLSENNNSDSDNETIEQTRESTIQKSRERTQDQENNSGESNQSAQLSSETSYKRINNQGSSAKNQQLTPVIYKTPRTRKRLHDNSETAISNALQKLENISTIIQGGTSRQVEDEFHYFAMNMAAQLRQLPLHVALNLQNNFQKDLSFARINAASDPQRPNSSSSTNSDPQRPNSSSSTNHSYMMSGDSSIGLVNAQDSLYGQKIHNSEDVSQQSFYNLQQEAQELEDTSRDSDIPLSAVIRKAWVMS
ncbi:hypothetical protein FQR65_LT16186 [Abscondita terminalis]|nr:hypothetical protein FQR65_LT16186 [Abscondita terminalis]